MTPQEENLLKAQIADFLEVPIYISKDNFELVYLNPAAKSVMVAPENPAENEPVSLKCYQTIAGRDKPCSFCVLLSGESLEKLHKSKFRKVSSMRRPQDVEGTEYTITQRILQSGGGYYVLGRLQDITREKNLEEESFRQEKLIALGTIIQSVAHEISNPLTGIGLTVQGLLESGNLPEVIRRKLKLIENDLKRAGDIVSDVRLYTRKVSYRLYPVNIRNILRRARQRVSMPQNLVFQVDWPSSVPAVIQGNSDKLMQVFINLFQNTALAYRENVVELKDLKIDVRAKVVTEEDPYRHESRDFLRVDIMDNAGGIPVQAMPHIFEPFFSKRKEGEGSGLGLFVVKRILKEHKARIQAENYKQGTRFQILFPLYEETAK